MTSKSGNFLHGLKNGIPICLGYLAVSFAFGIQAVQSGLTVFQATLLSLTNVTSAGQFAGLGIIAVGGSLIEMAGVQFVINLRYMLMSAALSQKLRPSEKTLHRLAIAFGVTDEIFAVSVSRPETLSPYFSYGCIFISVLGWTGGTFLGAFSGEILPQRLISALGVALYGMFIAIIIPPARENRKVLSVVLSAMIMACIFQYAPILKEVSSGFRIIIVTIVVAGAAAVIFPIEEAAENANV
ncbi:MAG: AzlC family ABC transporter permease [Lachnospiraceae bacterium]|nr:AzlC family ABC transporter permease [Lachnospiraceae bacterium]